MCTHTEAQRLKWEERQAQNCWEMRSDRQKLDIVLRLLSGCVCPAFMASPQSLEKRSWQQAADKAMQTDNSEWYVQDNVDTRTVPSPLIVSLLDETSCMEWWWVKEGEVELRLLLRGPIQLPEAYLSLFVGVRRIWLPWPNVFLGKYTP